MIKNASLQEKQGWKGCTPEENVLSSEPFEQQTMHAARGSLLPGEELKITRQCS